MSDLIAAIERFEAALELARSEPELHPHLIRTVRAIRERDELAAAEDALWTLLGGVGAADHAEVCEPCALGCVEGVSHNGSIYAQGHGDDGRRCIMVVRRVREASELDLQPVIRESNQ